MCVCVWDSQNGKYAFAKLKLFDFPHSFRSFISAPLLSVVWALGLPVLGCKMKLSVFNYLSDVLNRLRVEADRGERGERGGGVACNKGNRQVSDLQSCCNVAF